MKPWFQNPHMWYWNKKSGKYIPHKTKWKASRRRHWLKRFMSERGCAHCGETNPDTLCLDHINPEEKGFAVFKGIGSRQLSSIMEEVRKCQVLCHNCHAIKGKREGDFNEHHDFGKLVNDFCDYHGITEEVFYDSFDRCR